MILPLLLQTLLLSSTTHAFLPSLPPSSPVSSSSRAGAGAAPRLGGPSSWIDITPRSSTLRLAAAAAESEEEEEVWVEPWADAESSDLMRIYFDCFEKDKMVIDPWLLSEFLLETGAWSCQLQDDAKGTDAETPIFGEHGEPAWGEKIWDRTRVLADYAADIDVSAVLAMVKDAFDLGRPLKYRIERIDGDIDWQQLVQTEWKPIQLGENLVVKFTWHDDDDMKPFLEGKDKDAVKVMTLEGGAAFGSGEHQTTHMCCEWLQEYLATQPKGGGGEGLHVVDYGSGSGILALTALMFGAESSVGVEIDPFAIMSAYRNAEMNDLETLFLLPVEEKDDKTGLMRVDYKVVNPDGTVDVDEEDGEAENVTIRPGDVMLANILKGPLIQLSHKIASLTKLETGKIVLAGLIKEQAESVMAAYRPYFPDIHQANTKDDWSLLVGTRNNVPVASIE